MEIKQKVELRKLFVPELKQSLKILSLPLLDLKTLIEQEVLNNPLLELTPPENRTVKSVSDLSPSQSKTIGPDISFRFNLLTKPVTLHDILTRQLSMFADTDEVLKIGQEIIGNIDENGYLRSTLDELSSSLNEPLENLEKVLKLIQRFEPPGVGARTPQECILIQLEIAKETDPVLHKIVEFHLEDVAKKNYTQIAKALKEPQEKIEELIKKILKLDPKPGRNYTSEEIQHIIPDIIIDEKDDESLEIIFNDIDIPNININEEYKHMLESENADAQAKEFLAEKLHSANELLRAIAKRKATIRRIVKALVELQNEAIKTDLSNLKPLTFQDVAKKLDMHESTVCRAIMNKYIKLPCGVAALKDLFPSRIQDTNGQSVSSNYAKRLIKELVEKEDKKHPLSDQKIAKILATEHNLNISRRTVVKYREELKILSSTYRKER